VAGRPAKPLQQPGAPLHPLKQTTVDQRLFFPATERNRQPIGDLLETLLPRRGAVLEVASGSGEHAITFQRRFPHLLWQASDPDPNHQASIQDWIRHAELTETMPDPLPLDVRTRPWPLPQAIRDDLSAMVCINLLHISPPECTEALLQEAARLLPTAAPLILYGPFLQNGRHTSASNAAFDASLRQRDPTWGVRDLAWIDALAQPLPIKRVACHAMPANNLTVVLERC